MGKILGVALIGGLLLIVALYFARRNAASSPAAVGPAVGVAPSVTAGAPSPPPSAAAVAVAPAAPPSVAVAGPSDADTAACARLADLCSTSDQRVDPDACLKQLQDARKMAGSSNVDRSELCMNDAKTCAAASGCISGGVGMGAMGEFLKGLGGAMSH